MEPRELVVKQSMYQRRAHSCVCRDEDSDARVLPGQQSGKRPSSVAVSKQHSGNDENQTIVGLLGILIFPGEVSVSPWCPDK